jgi:hypothetical protein
MSAFALEPAEERADFIYQFAIPFAGALLCLSAGGAAGRLCGPSGED